MTRATPILYYGSKTGMVETLLSLMSPHHAFVEVFGGSGAVLLAKQPSKVEIYNDLDKDLCDFFRLIKNHEKARVLRHHLELTPYSRDVYNDYVERFPFITDEIERAVAFVVIANQSFNGKFGAGWKHSKVRNPAAPFFNNLRYIETAGRRLRQAQIENLDFEDVLKRYDAPETLFLLDPPYPPDVRAVPKAYRHEMTVEDHQRLLKAVSKVEGMVMLCGYAHPLYDEALKDWGRHEVEVYCRSTANKNPSDLPKTRTEVIWLNPKAADVRGQNPK